MALTKMLSLAPLDGVSDDDPKLAINRQASSPIHTLSPGYGLGKTPLFNTFESMEIDFNVDELSDDDEQDDDMVMLQDYESYDTWDSRDDNEMTTDQTLDYTLDTIDEKKQDPATPFSPNTPLTPMSNPPQSPSFASAAITDKSTNIKPSFAKRRSSTKSPKNGPLSPISFKPKFKKKSSGSQTVMLDAMTLATASSALPAHLSVDDDVVRAKPSLAASVSVPINQMKHYEVEGLTIWGQHQQDLQHLLEKWKTRRSAIDSQRNSYKNSIKARKGKKNIKFADMESDDGDDNEDGNQQNDMYLEDMKSQFSNYSDDIMVSEDDEQEQVRKYLIAEIVQTEESYVKGLETLLNEFIVPLFEQKLIKAKYKQTITCNIPQIYEFHEKFLEKLVQSTTEASVSPISPKSPGSKSMSKSVDFEEEKSMISVFYELCNSSFVDMYANYTKEYQNILNVLAKYNKKHKLQKYLKNKRKEKKPLTNYLILPIQRVTRYLLLLQELKKKTPSTHNDYVELEAVLVKINETVNTINERQREIENMSQCLQVQETMSGLTRNIVKANRKLLAQFLFRKKDNQRGRQFFLFNDLLIITNLKLKVKTMIEIRTIDLKRFEKNKLEFQVVSLNHEAMYETDADKIDDLDNLSKLIEENRSQIHRKTLQEVGAEDIAKLLITQSVSQAHRFRNEVSLKSQPSLESNFSITSATSNRSMEEEIIELYD